MEKERSYLNVLFAVMTLAGRQGGRSVNPITTRGADYAHHITASPPGFENPATSLSYTKYLYLKYLIVRHLVVSHNLSSFL